jgi:hypothetical protein
VKRSINLVFLLAFSLSLSAQSAFYFDEHTSKGFKDSRKSSVMDSSIYPPLFKIDLPRSKTTFHPMVEYLYASDNLDGNIQRWGIGGQLNYRSKRLDAGFTFLYNKGEYMTYRRQFIQQREVIPAFGNYSGRQFLESRFWDAFLSYKPAEFFEAEVGYGRKFIGEGHRSLLNSDFTSPYPYLKLQTSFWKLTYTNLFAAQTNSFGAVSNSAFQRQKFTASHYLELELFKKLRIGLFETVVWQADEGSFFRGLDPNYLNPVIFYRPVEFSVGSSDNVLIGLNLSYEPNPSHMFYFQGLLDEFLLSEMRADLNQALNPDEDIQSGWWGNKYGIQFGWKGRNVFGIEHLSSRIEYNLCRPYTYAHSNPTQAYTHNSLPLAHPLGANFQETILQLNYRKEKWTLNAQYNNALQGFSPPNLNFGENPEISNSSRTKEYENFTGQGIAQRNQYFEGYISRRVNMLWGAELSLGYVWRQSNENKSVLVNNMVYFGLRTNLIRQTFDF